MIWNVFLQPEAANREIGKWGLHLTFFPWFENLHLYLTALMGDIFVNCSCGMLALGRRGMALKVVRVMHMVCMLFACFFWERKGNERVSDLTCVNSLTPQLP